MKKIKIVILAFIMLLGATTILYAASAIVKLDGENEVKPEQEQTMTISISNSEAIGAIEGIISYDSNIKDVKINSSYNGWNVTYNEATGKFNAFKAEGTTNGEVIQITYKLKQNAQEGSFKLKNVELTTISYENIKIDKDISKTIKILADSNNKNESSNPINDESSNPIKNESSNPINNESSNSINNEKEQNDKINRSKTNADVTQTSNQTTLSEKILPKAGDLTNIIIGIIAILIIISLILYKKAQYYKKL